MKLQIGQVIKKHRREQGLTQEEFSERLGVSKQSVSRWEMGVCYPDVELLPVLAALFHISVDALLGVDDTVEKQEVDGFLSRFAEAISVGDVAGGISVAREGVAQYPNQYALLNKLMEALVLAGDETGNCPQWRDNFDKYDAEITAIGERIRKHCPDPSIRLEATARLAFNHCEHGRKTIGRAIYETLPSAAEPCRETEMWWALEESERLAFARAGIKAGYDLLMNGCYYLTDFRLLPDEELVRVFEKMCAISDIVFDGEHDINHHGKPYTAFHIAETYARLGRVGEARDALSECLAAAKAFDSRADSGVEKSLLLGDIPWRKTDYETADTRSCEAIMRERIRCLEKELL